MNTWSAFTAGSAASVVLHSVPPLVVFVAAEAVTELRGELGAVVAVAKPSGSPPVARPPARRVRRTSFSEYLAVAEAARTPDVVVTPAWVRQATGCSRGLSSRLAAALDQGGGRSCPRPRERRAAELPTR